MAETYFPFDSGAGANVMEAQWSLMARNWLPTGVIGGQLNELAVYADSSGMQVKVPSGQAWIQGHFYQNDAENVLPISTADPSNPRIDLVVLHLDWVGNTISRQVLQGTPAASPTPPAVTQNMAMWEIPLAQILVPAGAATIAAGDVTDLRPIVAPANGVVNPNLLFGGGFGLGSAGWSGIGSNGFHNVFGSGGEGSMLFNQTSTGSSVAAVTSTPIPVSAGTTLTLSADMSAAGVTAGSIYTQLIFYDSSGNSISGGSSIHATNGQSWARYSVTVTAPANCDHALVFCAIAASTTIASAAGWKRIKVEQGSIATTFSDDSTLNTVQYAQQLAGVFSGVDSWHAITLLNGWTNYGSGDAVAAYRMDASGFVHIKGLIKGGTTTSTTNLFLLPSGYRPLESHDFIVPISGASLAIIAVLSSGYVELASIGNANWTSLTIPPFLAEQ